MGSLSSYKLLAFHSVTIHKIGYMQISHVSEDDIVFIYPPSAGGSVRKGLTVSKVLFFTTYTSEIYMYSYSFGEHNVLR